MEVAKKLGADFTLLIKPSETEEEIVEKIHKLMASEPDKTIDASGVEMTNRLSLLAARTGGCALIIGNGPLNVSLPLMSGLTREVDIRGVFRYANTYPAALKLIEKVDLTPIITHRFELTDAGQAFETSRKGLNGAIKVMIRLN